MHTVTASEQISGPLRTRWAPVEHRGDHHRGLHITVLMQSLNRADVGTLRQPVPGESISAGVGARRFTEPGWDPDGVSAWGSVQPEHRAATTQAGAINAVHRGA